KQSCQPGSQQGGQRMVGNGCQQYRQYDGPWFLETGRQKKSQQLSLVADLCKSDGSGGNKECIHENAPAGINQRPCRTPARKRHSLWSRQIMHGMHDSPAPWPEAKYVDASPCPREKEATPQRVARILLES